MTKEKELQTWKVDKNPIATCQDAFMLIYWLHQILTPPFQTRWCFSTLLFSSCGESVWIVAFPVLKWYEWHLTKSSAFLSPFALRFNPFRFSSSFLDGNKWLFELLCISRQLKAVRPFSSDVWHWQLSRREMALTGSFYVLRWFCVNSRDGWAEKKPSADQQFLKCS